jgi:hypothetical protein
MKATEKDNKITVYLSKEDIKFLDTVRKCYNKFSGIFKEFGYDTVKDNFRYKAIPSSTSSLIYLLYYFSKKNRSFFDVGAGKGNMIALADILGFKKTGGVELSSTKDLNIDFFHSFTYFEKNVFELTNKIPGSTTDFFFDLIYMYRPMIQEEDLKNMLNHMLSITKPGTIFICNYFLPDPREFGKKLTEKEIFFKTKNSLNQTLTEFTIGYSHYYISN